MTAMRDWLSMRASRRVSSIRDGSKSAEDRAVAMSTEVRAATGPIGMGRVTFAAGQPPVGSLSGWKVVDLGSGADILVRLSKGWDGQGREGNRKGVIRAAYV